MKLYQFLYSRLSTNSTKDKYLSRAESAIEYSWEPAQNWTPDSPTLVYFYGYDGEISPTNMKHETWNLLCLSDRSGLEKKGSWYFGTDGNPWILDGVESIIFELATAGHLTFKNIFFSGKSMGGHAAIYFHQKFSGNACLVYNPTTWLIGSKYANQHLQLLDSIFNDNNAHEYNDLTQLTNPMHNVFIAHGTNVSNSYLDEQINRFIRSHSSVEVIGEKQYLFSELFTFFRKFEVEAKPITLAKHQELKHNPDTVSNVSVKLSSRPMFAFSNGIDFSIDPYSDRSWRFWLQNLSWLPNHLEQLPDEIRENQLRYIFQSWIDFIGNDISVDEFFYHDHSLAYRSLALLESLKYATSETITEIEKHIFEIGQLLVSPLEDNALSNHAFDQAIALFRIADYFMPNLNLEEWKKIALRRIKRELEYSFTPDGVHVENSPSYHHGMIINIHRSLKDVLKISNDQTIAGHIKDLSKTIPYLVWMCRPDGCVPPIGDSEEKVVSLTLAKQISPDIFNESNEGMRVFGKGYAIWRQESPQFHMTLKSCQHGRFHRHDDDCSITLWYEGMNLIHDSGLLFYNEKDLKRRYVRSPSGHSGIEIPKLKPIRNMFDKRTSRANVKQINPTKAKATLGMYANVNVKRTISGDHIKFVIEDEFCDKSLQIGVKQNFIVSHHWKIEKSKDRITFQNDAGGSWAIQLEDIELMSTLKIEEVIISPMKNKIEKANKITFVPTTNRTRLEFLIGTLSIQEIQSTAQNIEEFIEIRHAKFGLTNLTIPIDWIMDPYNSKNWRHHLNSLRWLKGLSTSIKEDVIQDFFDFHVKKQKKNSYFNTRAGDHTTTIRLQLLYQYFEESSSDLKPIIESLIEQDIITLFNPRVYRPGHNHGLMADVALLNLAYVGKRFYDLIDVNYVIERGIRTVDLMFHENGLTKEHSLSYQLWNLNYALEFFECLKRNQRDDFILIADQYKSITKEMLNHFSYSDGLQFALGDSFHQINKNLVEEIFTEPALLLENNISNAYSNQEFASVRYQTSKLKRVHLVMTSGFNSLVHKQNDDLSFCLSLDEQIIFGDGGYSDTATKEEMDFLTSVHAHSIITINGMNWDETTGINRSFVNNVKTIKSGKYIVSGYHERIPNIVTNREILLSDSGLVISDKLDSKTCTGNEPVRQRFVLSEKVIANIVNGQAMIENMQEKPIAKLYCKDNSAEIKLFSEGYYVGEDKRNIGVMRGIDIFSCVSKIPSIVIEFEI